MRYQCTWDKRSIVVWKTWHHCYNYTGTISKEYWTSFMLLLQGQQNLHFETQWFQQDGAIPHTATETMRKLEEMFNGRIISKRSDFVWSPHSPDLISLDFFLWGYCKENMYVNTPQSVQELQRSIEDFVYYISSATCERVISNFKSRISECVDRNGDHIEHRIYFPIKYKET